MNKIGMNTKAKIRNPVARPRSSRGREMEICFFCENGAGWGAAIGILQNRAADIVAASTRVGTALFRAGVGGSRSGVPLRASEQGSVASLGAQDAATNFLSRASDSLVCVSHWRI